MRRGDNAWVDVLEAHGVMERLGSPAMLDK